MERMGQMGIDLFVEVGPGKVLQGLARRTLPQAQTTGVTDIESLEAFLSR
jgi:[acyl-carrier-protein] S-malonyltransferase